jgi:peptide/nickel transport system substrate-binding protein
MKRSHTRAGRSGKLAALACALIATARCGQSPGPAPSSTESRTIRLGISNVTAQSADRGVQQFISNISNEGLLRVNQEGRLEPWLAEGWDRSPDGLKLVVRLRPNVKFHDNSPVDAEVVAKFLNDNLAKTMRATFEDVASIAPDGDRNVVITFRRPSSLVADALMDVPITKTTGKTVSGTGPYAVRTAAANGSTEMQAFEGYYLGRPVTPDINISTYPNGRAAWAELMRDRLDILYEADADAIELMRDSKNATIYSFDRPYQYVVFFNPRNPKLKAAAVRKALNEAVDRDALIKLALRGHGTPSKGPVATHHWAFHESDSAFNYSPQTAAKEIPKGLTLRCVTLAEQPFEQIALVLKQQLRAVGVDLEVVGVPVEQVMQTLSTNDFDTVLLEYSSGWSVMRAYRWWHSKGVANQMRFESPKVDAALDHVRHAVGDDDYRSAVAEFQQAIAADPPAIFLAWSERSRAVSKRFDVQPEAGRDVLATLRLWRPTADKVNATQD